MPPRQRPNSNPAQRLYDILERHALSLNKQAGRGYDAVWAEVLGVAGGAVTESVAQAFGLIGEIDRALSTTGDEFQRRNFELHKENWSRAFLPMSSGRSQVVNSGETSEAARAALGGIASHLRDNLSEGRVPTEDERAELRELVSQLIEEVRVDDTLPMHIADLMLRRLHDMSWALDHIEIMGADGIASAAERMAVAYVVAKRESRRQADQPDDYSKDEHERSALGKFQAIIKMANEVISVPGAWYGSWQLVEAVAPNLLGN